MESTTQTQIKVGMFLLIGVVIIAISILMLGADQSLLARHSLLHGHFDQVQGLSEGSVVSLSGVNIGNVENINFTNDSKVLDVVMKINKKYLSKITKSAKVEIRTQGALGDKYVFIIPGEPTDPVVEDGATLEVAKATDIIGIFSERGKETEKLFDIINEVYILTKSINQDQRVEKIMTNLTSATSNLKDISADAKKLVDNQKWSDSVTKLDSLLTKLDRGQGTLGALINDPSIHNQLKSLLGNSQRKNQVRSVIQSSISANEK